MSKLTKAQAKAHTEACRRLEQDSLSSDDRLFVLQHWQASAKHINSIAGAFFTPAGLAQDLSIEVGAGRVIDLCAGIGALALQVSWRHRWTAAPVELVCVEANPDYAAVGMKIVPEARWIVGDVFDLPHDLEHFDYAISNPPFGAVQRVCGAPRYKGREFELHVIDVASDIADYGVFIVPQMTAPFRYSGSPCGGWPATIKNGIGSGYCDCPNETHAKLLDLTGIVLEPNCGIDTAAYDRDWQGVSVSTEIVTADFVQARARRTPVQRSLFAEAAE